MVTRVMDVAGLTSIRLPVLRPDLQFFAGPEEVDGTPTFTVFDPLSGKYTKMGWAEATVLQYLKPGMTVGDLLEILYNATTLRVSAQEIIALCESAEQNSLLAGTSRKKAERLATLHQLRKVGALQWVLSHYLFFRIPLLRPDAFLASTVRSVSFLASRWAFMLYTAMGLLGVYLITGRLEAYFNTFADFFNWQGIAAYSAAIIGIKCIHEFAHAYTAKSFGVRVRSMGVAFMVFWPVPFCDVTDAWRLKKRWQRFLIGLAGVGSELVIAGCSLLLWAVSPDGTVRSICFVLSSVTAVSTLLVNLNPAMRFDGYYLLMDLSGVDNLQRRAFAVTKWRLRRWLLGARLPAPEEHLTVRRQAWMMIYSIYTWIYRFFLYLGIAVLVYHKFTKAIGVVLFLTEIWLFIVQPVLREGRELVKLRSSLSFNPRVVMTVVLLLALGTWYCLPQPQVLSLGAVVAPEEGETQTLYLQEAGVVEALHLGRGELAEEGDVILRVRSDSLETQIELLEMELDILAIQIDALSADEKKISLVRQNFEERAKIKARLEGLQNRKASCEVRAAMPGVAYNWNEDLRVGQSVQRGTVIGQIGSIDDVRVISFLHEDFLGAIKEADEVKFVTSGDQEEHGGEIRKISPVRADRIGYPVLTSVAQGDIPVDVTRHGQLRPRGSYYEIEVGFGSQPEGLSLGQAGFIQVVTKPRSRLIDTMRYIWGLVLQESGF